MRKNYLGCSTRLRIISHPGSGYFPSRIRIFPIPDPDISHPGSGYFPFRIRIFPIPDPDISHPRSGYFPSRIRIFFPFRILEPDLFYIPDTGSGSRGLENTGSRIRNTAGNCSLNNVLVGNKLLTCSSMGMGTYWSCFSSSVSLTPLKQRKQTISTTKFR